MRIFNVGVCLPALLALGSATQAPQQPPSILIESLAGRDSFESYCASCHGTTGRGDGPVAGALQKRPTDLTTLARRMRIENLVAYIESIQVPSTGPKDLGRQLFRAHCATCHGSTGRGDGPMADQLRRPAPDLTKYTRRNGGVFPRERVYRIVDGRDVPSHGDRDMPVWGDVFKQTGRDSPGDVKARIDAIVRHLESIQERVARLAGPRESVAVDPR